MKGPFDFRKKALPYLVTTAVGLVGFVLVLCIKQVWTQTDAQAILHILIDAFFVPGVLIAGVGLLVFSANQGTFDMLSYAFVKLFDLFRRDVLSGRYKNFVEYRESKEDRVHGVAYLLIVGLAFIAVSCVLLLVDSL